MLQVARGYSLRETVVRALRWRTGSTFRMSPCSNACATARSDYVCCVSSCFGENVAYLQEGISRTIRIVDGTIVREPGKTGSQWRILYGIRLPSLVCDFFEVTATIGTVCLWVRANLFSRMPATAQSLGLSMFGNMALMCWFASNLRALWRTLHAADVSRSFRDCVLSKANRWQFRENTRLPSG
jgi:hypothetical protein